MKPTTTLPPFWLRWLVAVTLGLLAFGLSMILAPNVTRQGFGSLLFGNPEKIATFGPEAVAYISLIHAVLGAVMLGWGCCLLFIFLGPFRRGSQSAWNFVVLSIATWFIADTTISLWSGFWPNAVLNLGFLILFGVPLGATYRYNKLT